MLAADDQNLCPARECGHVGPRDEADAFLYHLGTPAQGAANIVDQALALQKGERMVIILDRHAAEFLSPVRTLAEERLGRAAVTTYFLEEFGERDAGRGVGLDPDVVQALPAFRNMLRELERAGAGLYAGVSLGREVILRDRVRVAGSSAGGRFLHLPNMTPDILCMGFCADLRLAHAYTQAMTRLVRQARWARVTTAGGSDIRVAFGCRWVPLSSVVGAGEWANVGAEVFTCPAAVDGRWVADGGMGDIFTGFGLLAGQPLELDITGGLIRRIACVNKGLEERYRDYAAGDSCGNGFRIGEFALPTNPELTAAGLIGVNMQDEKALVHLASGNPRPEETMRGVWPESSWWTAKTHVDMSARGSTVRIFRSENDSVAVLMNDAPAEAVVQLMGGEGDRLLDRIGTIRAHIRDNRTLPPTRRDRLVRFV